jgi:putative hydrolase of the HAD superfamily
VERYPLKALLLDVDDTVYSTTEFASSARQNAVQAMVDAGLKIDPDDCLRELEEVISEFGSNYEHHFDKLLQRIPEECYAGSSRLIVVAAGMVAYHQTKFRGFSAYEDAIEVLRGFKEKGLPLGIVTAGIGIKQAEKVVRLGLHKIIPAGHIFITDTMGVTKSNPKLYMRVCKTLGVQPQECAYVGDNPAVDVDVPHRIGMKTILSRRSGKYMNVEGECQPDFVVHNFWDVHDVIEQHFEIIPGGGDS